MVDVVLEYIANEGEHKRGEREHHEFASSKEHFMDDWKNLVGFRKMSRFMKVVKVCDSKEEAKNLLKKDE